MNKYNFLLNRVVIFLLGLIAFTATSLSLSSTSGNQPQVCGFIIYLLFGLLLFRTKTELLKTLIFFLPCSIWIFVSLTGNPGLFPDVVPLLLITCIIGFYFGALVLTYISSKRIVAIFIITITGTAYLFVVLQFVVPRVIFNRLSQSVTGFNVDSKLELSFINSLKDTVTINSNRISVVDFWFTNCGVCYPNNDYLDIQARKYKNLGVDFYLIYMGEIDSFEKFLSTIKRSKWKNLIHLYDPTGKVSKMFNLQGAPHTLIYSDGRIIYHQSGFSEETESLEEEKLRGIIMQEIDNNADLKTLTVGDKNVIDLGAINPTYDTLHTFRLKNTTSNPISIQDVKTSCHCLAASWTKEKIPVNGYGSLSFIFDTHDEIVNKQSIVISTDAASAPFTVVNLSYSNNR